MFSNHEINLEINSRKMARKPQNTWRLNTAFQKNTFIKEKVSRKI